MLPSSDQMARFLTSKSDRQAENLLRSHVKDTSLFERDSRYRSQNQEQEDDSEGE